MKLGYRRLILDTSRNQVAAQRLYEKRGFRPYDERNESILYFELDLAEGGGNST